MFCYKGYECGFSLYDATYLASMVAAMTELMLEHVSDTYGHYDSAFSGMLGNYYAYTGDLHSYGYGGGWLEDYYQGDAAAMGGMMRKNYYYQYANALSYPGSFTKKCADDDTDCTPVTPTFPLAYQVS